MEHYIRIAHLNNEVEARLLGSLLNEQAVDHAIVSYHDSAFDGLFQEQRGWGHVEGPEGATQIILGSLQALRDQRAEHES